MANTPTGGDGTLAGKEIQWDTEGLPSTHLPRASKNKAFSPLYGTTATWAARTPFCLRQGLRSVLTHQQAGRDDPARSDEALHSSVPQARSQQKLTQLWSLTPMVMGGVYTGST